MTCDVWGGGGGNGMEALDLRAVRGSLRPPDFHLKRGGHVGHSRGGFGFFS